MITKITRDVFDGTTRPITEFILNNVGDPSGTRTIDDTIIGGTTPNAGTFTTAQAASLTVTSSANFTGASITGLNFKESITSTTLTTATTLVSADVGKLFLCNGTFSITLTAAATLGAGWRCFIRNIGTGNIVVDPNLTESIDGNPFIVISKNRSVEIVCTGSGFYSLFKNSGASFGAGSATAVNGISISVASSTTVNASIKEAIIASGFDTMGVTATGTITINAASVGINGLDTGTLGPSSWYAVYLVSNGTTTGFVLSTSFTTPSATILTTYPYYSRIGAVRTNASSQFLGTIQVGKWVQYIAGGINLTTIPTLSSGTAPVNTTLSVANVVPPTASKITLTLSSTGGSATQINGQAFVAPNANGLTGGNVVFVGGSGATNGYVPSVAQATFILETQSVYFFSNGTAPAALRCLGWEDNL